MLEIFRVVGHRADPMLVESWAIDQSRTTAESSACCRRRMSDQLLKVGLVESECLARLYGNDGRRQADSATGRCRQAEVARCLCQAKAVERLCRERPLVVDQSCRGA